MHQQLKIVTTDSSSIVVYSTAVRICSFWLCRVNR